MGTEITYTRRGDYLLPNITIGDQAPEAEPLGRYARMHRAFLREHRPILYNQLLLSGTLYPLLRDIDETANARFAAAGKVTEMERILIEQVIFADLVYF
jgi:hypothetical protein